METSFTLTKRFPAFFRGCRRQDLNARSTSVPDSRHYCTAVAPRFSERDKPCHLLTSPCHSRTTSRRDNGGCCVCSSDSLQQQPSDVGQGPKAVHKLGPAAFAPKHFVTYNP